MDRAPNTPSQSEYLISESQGQHLVQKTQRKTIMDLCQQGLEMGDNFTKSESWNSGAQKQPGMLCDQNHLEVERKTKKRKREGRGEKEEVVEEKLEKEQDKEEDKKEKKNKERHPKKKFVSRPLMDRLWATFKFNKNPTFQDISSLAFEFSMTETQINRWFCKKRKIYKKEIYWKAYKTKQKRC